MRRGLAVIKLFGVVATAAVIMPAQFVAIALHQPTARRIPKGFHKAMLWLIGLRVDVRGQPVKGEPVFFVSNHASYLDVVVLGSKIEACFVAKSEVARWPFFGWLAHAARTVFLERDRRAQTGRQRDTLIARLAGGDSLVLFPEGTSNDGNRMERFKSALLSAAEGEMPGGGEPWVQPVSIAYTGVHGIPMGRPMRPKFAWYGDMELVPHLYDLMQIGPCEVEVHFLEPVRASDFASRKHLSEHCHSEISAALGAALQGKPVQGIMRAPLSSSRR